MTDHLAESEHHAMSITRSILENVEMLGDSYTAPKGDAASEEPLYPADELRGGTRLHFTTSVTGVGISSDAHRYSDRYEQWDHSALHDAQSLIHLYLAHKVECYQRRQRPCSSRAMLGYANFETTLRTSRNCRFRVGSHRINAAAAARS